MRNIPSFNPSTPTIGQALIPIGSAGAGSKVLMYNHSPYNIALDFMNGDTSILHAWEARYWPLDGETPSIAWSIDSVLNVATPPLSRVTIELFNPGEPIPGQYPIDISQQTSISNPGGVPVAVSAITNDGNASGVSVIEATQAGSSGSNASLLNDGTFILSSYIAGILAQFFKSVPGAGNGASVLLLGDANRQVEILGALKVDGTIFTGVTQIFGALSAMSTASLDNGKLVTDGNGNITTVGSIKNAVTPVTVTGTGGGNIAVTQTWTGTDQRVKIVFNNWNTTAGVTQTITLPTPMNGTNWWFVGAAANGIEALSGGVAQTFGALTALGSTGPGSTTPVSIVKANSIGRCISFDTLRFTGSGAAVSGLTIIEG